MHTELAFDYASTAQIMDTSGFNLDEIRDFLIKNQSKSGYIPQSSLPKIRQNRLKIDKTDQKVTQNRQNLQNNITLLPVSTLPSSIIPRYL